ncbi:MAG: hypothetical protein A2V70_18830 [Planctomycetes bacterium RBG_13_63_9]|nr:MAG: hypothetical protein A2V70_18830 [Planctomycetes bacterium RBG_13_63_9]
MAWLIGAAANEIVFTSGATESCNLAIKGVAEKYGQRGNHIVTCLAEHEAVFQPCRWLESQGFNVTWLRPDEYGRVSGQQVDQAITAQTVLVSIMAANNVVGSINPTAEIGQIAKRRGVLFHCDATQAVGKIPVDVEAMGIDLLSLSAHKSHGPKGVGALYVRGRSPKVRLSAQIDGGGQEGGLRSGTLNVPGIVGMGKACEIARDQMDEDADRIIVLRDRFLEMLSQRIPGTILNGHPEQRLPNTLNITLDGAEATELMQSVPEIAASLGSACTSGTDDPHYVLRAMGLGEDHAAGSVRFSLGRFTTKEEIDYCIEALAAAVTRLRQRGSQFAAGQTCLPGCCEGPGCSDVVQIESHFSSHSLPRDSTAQGARKGSLHETT